MADGKARGVGLMSRQCMTVLKVPSRPTDCSLAESLAGNKGGAELRAQLDGVGDVCQMKSGELIGLVLIDSEFGQSKRFGRHQ